MAVHYDIPWHMLKGLDPSNSELCTLKGSVATGLEPSARDEIAMKLKSVAFCARGRVFFDVKMDEVSQALKLRSLDHINVLISVEPKFGFTKDKDVCLKKLRLLPRTLDWNKALSVWQRSSGFTGDPYTRRAHHLLEVIDLSAGPGRAPAAAGDGPPDTRQLLDSLRAPVTATRVTAEGEGAPPDSGGQMKRAQQGGAGQAVGGAECAEESGRPAEEAAAAAAGPGERPGAVAGSGGEVKAEGDGQGTVGTGEGGAGEAVASADASSVHESVKDTTQDIVQDPASDTAKDPAADTAGDPTSDTAKDPSLDTTEDPAPGVAQDPAPDTAEDPAPAPAEDTVREAPAPAPSAPDGSARRSRSAGSGVPSFRATCYRAGGGKQGHAFSSNEAAENFGGAVQDLFNWNVRMKQYDLEVILDVEFDMVSVGLSLTPRALFYRNLVKMGPTSLRATICYNLLMMAKPQNYEVVVDPMCGGGSISLEGAQAFPGSYHICGDNYPDAAPRVVLNRAYSGRQRSETAQLPVDVLTWDCTRLPLRDACADVIVSDLPFGKRLGSRVDNRTLYPNCMEEMARISVPRYGRAVLLTQDKNTMQKTLYHPRIKQLWRCRAAPYVNIGGLTGCAYLLQRTDFVKRAAVRRPAPARPAEMPPPPEVPARAADAPGAPEAPDAAASAGLSSPEAAVSAEASPDAAAAAPAPADAESAAVSGPGPETVAEAQPADAATSGAE